MVFGQVMQKQKNLKSLMKTHPEKSYNFHTFTDRLPRVTLCQAVSNLVLSAITFCSLCLSFSSHLPRSLCV